MWIVLIINVDEPDASDVAVTSSNVRKDLTEWQEKHATLVLTNVKVKSKWFISL